MPLAGHDARRGERVGEAVGLALLSPVAPHGRPHEPEPVFVLRRLHDGEPPLRGVERDPEQGDASDLPVLRRRVAGPAVADHDVRLVARDVHVGQL